MAGETSWILRPDTPIPAGLARLKQDRRVLQLLARVGIQTAEEALAFMDASQYRPTSAYELPDIERAVSRTLDAIDRREPVLVWGDFDVDGITSTSLLVEVLRAVGAVVEYTIPTRLEEGHGVHIPRAMKWVERGIKLMITVDTGISAHAAIDALNVAGVDVIVTDHHQLSESLPDALANVNSQRLAESHPLHVMSGAGVAYKFAEAICGRLNRTDLLPAALELAAIGLIADVVPLLRENRYLVQTGLAQLRRTQRQGIKALCHVAKLMPDVLDEEDVAFQLAPRLNALGRLADAIEGVELLTTPDPGRAAMLANQVDALNVKRRSLTQQVVKGAESMLLSRPDIADSSVLVLSHESWPAGVLGLAASQLAEKYGKPALVIRSAKGELARGSARSVEGVNVNALLSSHSHLLTQWGGHDMAAGFALEASHIEDLRLALSRAVRIQGAPRKSDVLEVDILLPIGEGDVGSEILRRLAPFGAGFAKPLFVAQGVTVIKEATIGRDAQHLKLTVQEGESDPQTVLMWNTEAGGWAGRKVDIAYRLRARETSLEIVATQIFEREDSPAEQSEEHALSILDWRKLSTDDIRLQIEQFAQKGLRVEQWREGQAEANSAKNHLQLEPADVLVIWHAPPNRQTLKNAVERTGAVQIGMVGLPCVFDELNALTQAVLGAVRFAALKQDGVLEVERLAGRLGHTRVLVETALRWLASEGRIALTESSDSWRVAPVQDTPNPNDAARILASLKAILAETASFRRFVQTADLNRILG